MKKILLVEDDKKIVTLLTEYLGRFEFDVSSTSVSENLEIIMEQKPPDLIILDIMLPGKSGLEICKEIRQKSSIPIIMLTARGDVNDRILGLELGADDYIPKPFEPRELVARINAVLGRSEAKPRQGVITIHNLEINTETFSVQKDGKTIELSTIEFDTLVLLARTKGKVWTRDAIMNNLHGVDWSAYNRSIDILISRLRQKLEDNPKTPKYIQTVWGKGYRFLG